MRPPKPHQTHDQLIMGLEANGLRIKDKVAARQALRKHGYHRLSGYRYLFRELLPTADQDQSLRTFRGKKHIPGTSFEQVIALAEFDRDLRMMVLRATEVFEVRLRTAVAVVLSAKCRFFCSAKCRNPNAHDSRCTPFHRGTATGRPCCNRGLEAAKRWHDPAAKQGHGRGLTGVATPRIRSAVSAGQP